MPVGDNHYILPNVIPVHAQVHHHWGHLYSSSYSGVGKSCLLLQFLENKFKFDHDTTIGVEFGSKVVSVKGILLKLQVWDTAGQETFKSITRSYYRGSIGVILVYDITSRESFEDISKWLEETKNFANDKVSIILVGNKTDL